MRDAIATSDDLPVSQEARRRVVDLYLGFIVDKEVAGGNAQCRGPEMKAHWDATHASPSEGVGSAISARAATQRNEALGHEPSAEEAKSHGNLVRAAKERELAAWKKFKVFEPVTVGTAPKATVDAR